MTVEQDVGFLKFLQSRILIPTETGTKVQFTHTRPDIPEVEEWRKQWLEGAGQMEAVFIKAIADEVANGNITLT